MCCNSRRDTSCSVGASVARSPSSAIRSSRFSSVADAMNSSTASSPSLCAIMCSRRKGSSSSDVVFCSSSVSRVSSLAASSRSAIASPQPLWEANDWRNSRIFGNVVMWNGSSMRLRRGSVTSTKSVKSRAVRPPAVMPFCNNPPAKAAKYSGKITPF